MKTYCPKCGTAYEVTESQKNSYMFCLNCDQFFKATNEPPASSSEEDIPKRAKKSRFYKKSTNNSEVKAKFSLIINLKKAIKEFFAAIPKPVQTRKNIPDMTALSGEQQSSHPKVEQPPARDLINNFLGPESDFMNQMDAAPTEYLDFLSSGGNASPAERLKANARNASPAERLKANARNKKNSQRISVSASKKYDNITIK